MAKRKQLLAKSNRDRAQRDADVLCRRIGLPTSQSPESVIGSIRGALNPDILNEYDEYAGQDAARLTFMFDEPERAMWLSVGLRMPLVRLQLGWLLWVLRENRTSAGATLLDVGSGCGFTAVSLANALGAHVYAVDPQPGSVAAAGWVADRLGTKVEASETSMETWALPDGAEPDVVIAQAVLWYLQPDLDNDAASLASLVAEPPMPNEQMALLLDRCAKSEHALVMDHDFLDLWVLVVDGLAKRGMFPDWPHAELISCRLPGRDDRQLSLPFTRTPSGEDDLSTLSEALGSHE